MKTFGQLKAGDEVYVIKGSDLKIVKVSKDVTPSPIEKCVWVMFGCIGRSMPSDLTSYHNYVLGDVYSDIDDAMRRMQDICAKALHDYREASGSLNLLETKKKTL